MADKKTPDAPDKAASVKASDKEKVAYERSGEQRPGDEPANIDPATEFDPAGAPVQIVPDVDPSHPAVDADPRARTSVNQNRIDFNDPTIPGAEAVAKNLDEQSKAKAKD